MVSYWYELVRTWRQQRQWIAAGATGECSSRTRSESILPNSRTARFFDENLRLAVLRRGQTPCPLPPRPLLRGFRRRRGSAGGSGSCRRRRTPPSEVLQFLAPFFLSNEKAASGREEGCGKSMVHSRAICLQLCADLSLRVRSPRGHGTYFRGRTQRTNISSTSLPWSSEKSLLRSSASTSTPPACKILVTSASEGSSFSCSSRAGSPQRISWPSLQRRNETKFESSTDTRLLR